jgi:hypothetical protein
MEQGPILKFDELRTQENLRVDSIMEDLLKRDSWPTCSEMSEIFNTTSNDFMGERYGENGTPNNPQTFYARIFCESVKRHRMTENWSFALPCKEALDKITSYSPVIEIGSGRGLWAHLLKKNGCDIIASDIKDSNWYKSTELLTDIEDLSALDAISKYPNRTVLTCWPPYGFYLMKKHLAPIKNLIYIGEDDGCTGSMRFERNIHRVFNFVDEAIIPQWWGIHDYLRVFTNRAL